MGGPATPAAAAPETGVLTERSSNAAQPPAAHPTQGCRLRACRPVLMGSGVAASRAQSFVWWCSHSLACWHCWLLGRTSEQASFRVTQLAAMQRKLQGPPHRLQSGSRQQSMPCCDSTVQASSACPPIAASQMCGWKAVAAAPHKLNRAPTLGLDVTPRDCAVCAKANRSTPGRAIQEALMELAVTAPLAAIRALHAARQREDDQEYGVRARFAALLADPLLGPQASDSKNRHCPAACSRGLPISIDGRCAIAPLQTAAAAVRPPLPSAALCRCPCSPTAQQSSCPTTASCASGAW